ncbi:MAG: hypothetical protein AB4911_11255 [Oscillochloridaceae bacterium umkhey_bin13]
MRLMRILILVLLPVFLLSIAAATTTQRVYLPLVLTSPAPPPPTASRYRINVPYFPNPQLSERFGELAIFWFGQVDQTRNYADVRWCRLWRWP